MPHLNWCFHQHRSNEILESILVYLLLGAFTKCSDMSEALLPPLVACVPPPLHPHCCEICHKTKRHVINLLINSNMGAFCSLHLLIDVSSSKSTVVKRNHFMSKAETNSPFLLKRLVKTHWGRKSLVLRDTRKKVLTHLPIMVVAGWQHLAHTFRCFEQATNHNPHCQLQNGCHSSSNVS